MHHTVQNLPASSESETTIPSSQEGGNTRLLIPPTTQDAIANPAAPGHRHEQAKSIACSLAAQKFAPEAIKAQLRAMYANDISDEEIGRVVDWAVAQDYEPACFGPRFNRSSRLGRRQGPAPSPVQLVEAFLDGFKCSQEEVSKASPMEVPSDFKAHCALAIQNLYEPADAINIVTDYTIERSAEGKTKAKPKGHGCTRKRDEWIAHIQQHGTAQSEAGAWLRMNPVDGRGIADANVAAFRYCLLESDSLPEELQIAFLAKLRLPIALIVNSGGRSCHAWVKVNAGDAGKYAKTVRAICSKLVPLGWDDANKNPGRLSRLPGAQRQIGASGDGVQRLVYLNPNPEGCAII